MSALGARPHLGETLERGKPHPKQAIPGQYSSLLCLKKALEDLGDKIPR